MVDTNKILPPPPGEVVDGALGIVEDIADKAADISRNDPLAIGAGLVGKTVRRIRSDL